jgi:hypothetical protein
MWEDLAIPVDLPVMAALQPIQAFVSADEMCSAVEHLTILAEGALSYADVDYSQNMARLADQIMDRLVFEQSLRLRSDLLNRSVTLRCILAFLNFVHGRVRRSSELMISCINNMNNTLPGHALNPMLLMQVHSLHWAFHGDESSLEAAVRPELLPFDILDFSSSRYAYHHYFCSV